MTSILTTIIKYEYDVVTARQRAKQIAEFLGFDSVEQIRIATSVSELARNIHLYAKQGKIEFSIGEDSLKPVYLISVTDNGPGIKNLDDIIDGNYRSTTGMGLGISGSRKLMDGFEINSSSDSGTAIRIWKFIPPGKIINEQTVADIVTKLVQIKLPQPLEEIQKQNNELNNLLQELEKKNLDLVRMNQELNDTNRGVIALYSELDVQAEKLKSADRIKSRFLSYMSHEFRTPVMSVLKMSEFLMEEDKDNLNPEQEKQIMFIQRSMHELLDMVNDFLDLSKAESGKISIYPSRFTVNDMFSTLRGMFRPLIANSKVSLTFQDATNLPPLNSDENKIAQILRNFISNALKFTQAGEINVSAVFNKKDKSISFIVKDTGIGISETDQKLIFEDFSQIEHSIQRNVKGTGLGLPLSKILVELLGGYIKVESSPGNGSKFSATIPVTYSSEMSQNYRGKSISLNMVAGQI